MLRSSEEYDLLMTLAYSGKGTMLVGGQQVNPVDWWSKQWIEDRVLRKISAVGDAPQ